MASTSTKEDEMDKENQTKSDLTNRSINMDELRELADLVDERGFTDFEIKNDNIRVRMSKSIYVTAPMLENQPTHNNQSTANVSTSVANKQTVSEVVVDEVSELQDDLHIIPSPIVGTFYRSPSPDKPPYVKEGDTVSNETVVCIVEAMKLMNEIQAEVAGEIVKIYVENAQPVEYGQPLFGIKQ